MKRLYRMNEGLVSEGLKRLERQLGSFRKSGNNRELGNKARRSYYKRNVAGARSDYIPIGDIINEKPSKSNKQYKLRSTLLKKQAEKQRKPIPRNFNRSQVSEGSMSRSRLKRKADSIQRERDLHGTTISRMKRLNKNLNRTQYKSMDHDRRDANRTIKKSEAALERAKNQKSSAERRLHISKLRRDPDLSSRSNVNPRPY